MTYSRNNLIISSDRGEQIGPNLHRFPPDRSKNQDDAVLKLAEINCVYAVFCHCGYPIKFLTLVSILRPVCSLPYCILVHEDKAVSVHPTKA
jgi:hypothetical protein